jgi:hypothetical protein
MKAADCAFSLRLIKFLQAVAKEAILFNFMAVAKNIFAGNIV